VLRAREPAIRAAGRSRNVLPARSPCLKSGGGGGGSCHRFLFFMLGRVWLTQGSGPPPAAITVAIASVVDDSAPGF